MRLLAQTATQWQLETHWTWAPWVTALVIAALVALVIWLYRSEVSPAGPWYRSLLAGLRLASLAIVLAMLSELVLSSTRLGKPRLELLIDRSPSMAEEDVSGAEENSTTRFASTKEFWLTEEGENLRQLAERYDLSITAVSGQVAPITGTGSDLVLQLDALELDGADSRTRLGDAIMSAASPRMATAPAAVVAFTDGRITAGRSLEQAAAIARRRGVPLYLVGLGSTQRPPDLALEDVVSEPVVFAGDLATIGATVSAVNLDGNSVQVTLTDVQSGERLAEQTVTIQGEQFSERVALVFEPQSAGTLSATLDIEPLASEENIANNSAVVDITVTDEPVQVLLAAGYPNYEFRFLKTMLDRDTKFKIATYLQEADLDYARQDSSAIVQLPLTVEQFAEFDVVVLLDLDPRLLPPLVWESLEKVVSERGAGLLLASGPRYFPWAYRQNDVIARLSPIDFATSDGTGVVDNGFRPEWTDIAKQLANLQLARMVEESSDIWRKLAPQYWYAEAGTGKPAAQVLAVHPTQRNDRGESIPLVALQYYGAGRVLYQGIDDTWRWRLRVGDVYFARYWGQTLRMLARGKMLSDAAGAQLLVERHAYQPGEVIRLSLRASGTLASDLAAAAPIVSLEAAGQASRRIAFDRQPATGRYAAELHDLPPGKYRGFLVEPALQPAPAAIDFEIVAPPGELTDVTLNRAALETAATTTLGKYYDLADADNLLSDLPAGEQIAREAAPPVELWNKWWMLAALTACLVSEWILRKRKAML